MDANKYYDLVKAIAQEGDEFLADLLLDNMRQFPAYVNAVYNMTMQMPILRFRLDGEEFRDRVQQMDQKRRDKHNAAICACEVINNMCKSLGVEPFCPETEDRYEIGEFCATIVIEMFHVGTVAKRDLESLIEAMDAPFDEGMIDISCEDETLSQE